MTDILDDARETLAEITELRSWADTLPGCRRVHFGCLIAAMIREIERLRLTDAERVAVLWAIASLETDPEPDGGQNQEAAGILREMLDRMRNCT